MPTRQSAAIVRAALAALGLEVDHALWSADLRRGGTRPVTLADLDAQLDDLARRADLASLRRAPDDLDGLAEAGAFPSVVLAEPPVGLPVGFVLARRERGVVQGVRVDAEGVATPVALPLPGLRAAIEAEARTAAGGRDASRADAPLPLACRVLVSVAPTTAVLPDDAGRGAAARGPMGPGRRLWDLVLRERRDVLLVYGYATLAGLFSLALPLSIQQIVTMVSGRMLLQPTFILVAFVVLGTFGVGILQVMQLSVVETIQQRVFARMALEFSVRVPRLRWDAVARENLPEVMNRFFEAVTIQKGLAKLLLDTSTALLTIFFGLVLLTLYHPYFTFFSAALVAGLVAIFWWTGPQGIDTSLMESKYKYRTVHWLEEIGRAITAFKYAGGSTLAVERMDDVLAGYLKYRRRHFRVLVQQTLGFVGFKTLITGVLLVLGIALVQGNQITLGQFVASEIVIVMVLAGIEKLITGLATIYDVLTAVEKAGYVTDLPLEPAGGLALGAAPQGTAGLAIVAQRAAYRYPGVDRPAMHGVSLAIAPGERVGITGYDGSGQTTLLRLLGGLLDGYEGGLSFDGLPLRDLDRAALRGQIGQVLSPSDLFDGTVEENVAVGRPHVTTRDVLQALDAVGLGDWVQALPQGLRTPIASGGRGLATSVASRLLVAQGIAGRPRLVVVDDYFQSLPPADRRRLVACLTDRERPWTLLVVSHDPALLAGCDRVLVVDAGQVVRIGPYASVAAPSAEDAPSALRADERAPALPDAR